MTNFELLEKLDYETIVFATLFNITAESIKADDWFKRWIVGINTLEALITHSLPSNWEDMCEEKWNKINSMSVDEETKQMLYNKWKLSMLVRIIREEMMPEQVNLDTAEELDLEELEEGDRK